MDVLKITGEVRGVQNRSGQKMTIERANFKVAKHPELRDSVILTPHNHRGFQYTVEINELKRAKSLGQLDIVTLSEEQPKSDTLVDRMLNGESVDKIVEEFKFKGSTPSVTLSYDSRTRKNIVSAMMVSTDPPCGGTTEFKQAISKFSREALKFLRKRGLRPVGKPYMCGREFIWEYEDDPSRESSFTPAGFSDDPMGVAAGVRRAMDKSRQSREKRMQQRSIKMGRRV